MVIFLRACTQYAYGTPEYISSTTNGCGSGWTTIVVPQRFEKYSLRACCDIHDVGYSEGKTWADKDLLDDQLRENIDALLFAQIAPWRFIERWLAKRDAEIYHNAVRYFGDSAFWVHKVSDDDYKSESWPNKESAIQGILTLKMVTISKAI